MVKGNSKKKKSVVKGIRLKTNSIVYRWWENTESPSTIVKYILKHHIQKGNIPTNIDNSKPLYTEIDNVMSDQEFEDNIDLL
jgi:hypothetical protein